MNDEESVNNIIFEETLFAERDETSVTEITFNRAKDRVLVSLEIHRMETSKNLVCMDYVREQELALIFSLR